MRTFILMLSLLMLCACSTSDRGSYMDVSPEKEAPSEEIVDEISVEDSQDAEYVDSYFSTFTQIPAWLIFLHFGIAIAGVMMNRPSLTIFAVVVMSIIFAIYGGFSALR